MNISEVYFMNVIYFYSTWDLSVDDLIIQDSIGLHLIYVQTVSDIENGWILVPKESLKHLTSLQSQANKHDVRKPIENNCKSSNIGVCCNFFSFHFY